MPKIDLDAVPQINRTGYPPPYNAPMSKRHYRRLAPAASLSDFGVSHVVLESGGISSQRHWHESEDEFLVMIDGEAVLVDDAGEHVLRAGDCAAFPKGDRNGHHLQNRSEADCAFVVMSAGEQSGGNYPDIDMRFTAEGTYVQDDGTPYEAKRV